LCYTKFMALSYETCEKCVVAAKEYSASITDIKFKTYGCGSAIASSSELIDMLRGKTLKQAEDITNKEIANALDLPPIKIHCSILAEESIEKALADYRRKHNYRSSENG